MVLISGSPRLYQDKMSKYMSGWLYGIAETVVPGHSGGIYDSGSLKTGYPAIIAGFLAG
jgi:hypothetical protein